MVHLTFRLSRAWAAIAQARKHVGSNVTSSFGFTQLNTETLDRRIRESIALLAAGKNADYPLKLSARRQLIY